MSQILCYNVVSFTLAISIGLNKALKLLVTVLLYLNYYSVLPVSQHITDIVHIFRNVEMLKTGKTSYNYYDYYYTLC